MFLRKRLPRASSTGQEKSTACKAQCQEHRTRAFVPACERESPEDHSRRRKAFLPRAPVSVPPRGQGS